MKVQLPRNDKDELCTECEALEQIFEQMSAGVKPTKVREARGFLRIRGNRNCPLCRLMAKTLAQEPCMASRFSGRSRDFSIEISLSHVAAYKERKAGILGDEEYFIPILNLSSSGKSYSNTLFSLFL
jgi:hypothetical protein